MNIDVPRYVMRVRRLADLSQRDLASRLGLSRSVVAQFETGARTPTPALLSRILAIAGLRLAVLDARDNEVAPTPSDPIRDNGGRRLPVHLDVAHREPWWCFNHPHYDRVPPVAPYLMRPARDEQRAVAGVQGDQMTARHLLAERAAWVAQREARRRARAAAAAPAPECLCPDQCYEGACLSPCACQCEPDPSGPAAFLRTRWVA